MPAGTITVTNGSSAVTGSGTSFTTELKVGDFIGVVAGGTPYTLVVAAIASNTQLTIGGAFTGPTASGLAWYGVPASLMYAITQQEMNNMGRILRGMIQEKANWQQVYSATGNITVTLPDGSQYTGPSWQYITAQFSGKLDKTGGAMTGSLTVPGIELQGATPFIDFHFGNTTADFDTRLINDEAGLLRCTGKMGVAKGILSRTGANGGWGTSTYNFYWDGGNSQIQAWIDASRVGIVSLSSTSDKGLKKDIKYREDASKGLDEVLQWRPADFKMKARGIIPETPDQLGFIANDLVAVSPECVSGAGLPDDYDIEADPNNPDAYYLNPIPMIAKLAQAIQAQQEQIADRDAAIEELQKRLKALDGLDA